MIEKSDWDLLAKRVLRSIETGEREFYAESYVFPASNYTDAQRWQEEVELIFKRRPVVLAFSSELAEPNSYVAMQRVGVPILLTRDDRGAVHGFLNVCRHRGAPLTANAEQCGVAKRFTCPYHAWTYDSQGKLVGIPSKGEFGNVPDNLQHLVPISVAERAGLIFGILTPGIVFDVDAFLGPMLPKLERLGLESFTVFDRRSLPGGNWKVAMDGYFENYHFNSLHKDSFGQAIMADHALFEDLGPHSEFAFSKPEVHDLKDLPQDQWRAHALIQLAQYVFPNFVGAHRLDEDPLKEPYMFFQIWPGESPDKSTTYMTAVTPKGDCSPDDEQMLQEFLAFSFGVVDTEDYRLTRKIQEGLGSMEGQDFVFGRMERLCTHYHKTIDRILAGPSGPGGEKSETVKLARSAQLNG